MEKDLRAINDGVANLRRVLCRLVFIKDTLDVVGNANRTADTIYSWRDMVELSMEQNIQEMNEILTDISDNFKDIKFKPERCKLKRG